MTKEEMKNKYSAFITEISEILGLGKPVDILKLCATTDLFFQPLEKRIAELEKENSELKDDNKVMADNYSKMEQKFYDNLTKAKVFIRNLKSLIEDVCDINYLSKASTKLLVEAEQFLNSEVEK